MTNFYHVDYVCTKTDSKLILRKMQLGLLWRDAVRDVVKDLAHAQLIRFTEQGGIITVTYEAMA